MKKVTIVFLLLSQFSLLAQNYKFGKVSKEELEEQFYPLDSTAEAAYLFKKRRTFYDYVSGTGFRLVTEYHERIKIYSKEGFNMATKSIGYYSPQNAKSAIITSIKGYTYNLEAGKVVKEKLSKNGIFKERLNKYTAAKKITMPNIKEGSVIELKYMKISPYIISVGDFRFQYHIPVRKLDYKIEIPEFFIFNKKSIGYHPVTLKNERKSGRIGNRDYVINVFRFDEKNIPALKDDEPYVSSIYNYRAGMKFELQSTDFITIGGGMKSYSSSWEDVSNKIYQSSGFGSQLKKSSYFKDDLKTILATAKTEQEKTMMILQFVKNQVKWDKYKGKYSEKGVKVAYKEHTGNVADINLMLTSMLRSVGLEANPVLVSTRNNGVPIFPTLKGFNYVIAMVEFKTGGYALLDATEMYSTPNVLPTRVLNWNGRKVTKDGASSWVELMSKEHALEENSVMITITDDLLVEGLIRTKYAKLNALNYRKNNNHIPEDDLITKLEEENKIEIDNFLIRNKEDILKPVQRNVKFTSEDLVEEINGKLYIEPLLFLSQHQNPFKAEERKFPVDFATPWKDKNIVSIQIPAGYKVESLPTALAIGMPENLGVFKFKVSENAGKISTICILQFNNALIAAHHYPVLKDFYGQLVKKQSEKIVLVKI